MEQALLEVEEGKYFFFKGEDKQQYKVVAKDSTGVICVDDKFSLKMFPPTVMVLPWEW